jgi:Tfp pilus assembly protein FimT
VKHARGFTLVESVLVILLTLILTSVALGGLRGVQSWRAAAAVRRVQADLLYARNAALTSGRRTLCVFDLARMTYEIQQESSPGSGAVAATPLEHPVTGAAWSVALSDLAAGLQVRFAPALNPATFGFDAAGLPMRSTGGALGSDLVMTFGGVGTLTIRAGSGLCEVTWP